VQTLKLHESWVKKNEKNLQNGKLILKSVGSLNLSLFTKCRHVLVEVGNISIVLFELRFERLHTGTGAIEMKCHIV
jgi:hypothetical protein